MRPSLNTHQTRLASLFALVLVALLGSVGCRGTPKGFVPINRSEALAEGPLAVDIQNNRGSVTVIVNPKLEQPKITAIPRGKKAGSGEWSAASLVMDAGRPVLRVLTAPPESGEAPIVDIKVYVPDCSGARIRTDDGIITLKGVRGAIDAQTSHGAKNGSVIYVNTTASLQDPMLLRAERGGIEVRMGKDSAGRLQAEAPNGQVEMDAVTGELRDVRYTRQTWTGTLNNGRADFRMTANDGNIVVMVGR
jgi:hypothetical protein